MLKLYNLVLYPLALICSFLIGILIAVLADAAEGQMLAGGAIVLGYGVLGAIIGLVAAIWIAINLKREWILKINIALLILSLVIFGYFLMKS